MNESLPEKAEAPVEEKDYALIAVAAGDGLKKLFEEYRVDVVISGGQTMNPSTEDFVAAIKKVKAKHIFILPNNSNIILAAQQAAAVMEDQDIRVLQTKSIPQGLSACIMFNPEVSAEENEAEMTAALQHVKTGQITYAIKDTTFDGMEIVAGDYMGIAEKSIVISTPNKMDACLRVKTPARKKRPRSPGTSKISSAWKRISRPEVSLSTRLSLVSNKSKGQRCKYCKSEV